jgi:hypothetical protein
MATDVVTKGLQKFAASAADEKANKFGILNSRGELVTNAYLSRYVQCWCRKEHGYVKDRKANFAYFMSDQFLATMVGKTASQVGKAASLDARWDLHKPATGLPAQPVTEDAMPVETVATAPTEQVFETSLKSEPAGEPAPRLTKKQLAELARKQHDIEVLRAQADALKATSDDPATAGALSSIAREIEVIDAQ